MSTMIEAMARAALATSDQTVNGWMDCITDGEMEIAIVAALKAMKDHYLVIYKAMGGEHSKAYQIQRDNLMSTIAMIQAAIDEAEAQ